MRIGVRNLLTVTLLPCIVAAYTGEVSAQVMGPLPEGRSICEGDVPCFDPSNDQLPYVPEYPVIEPDPEPGPIVPGLLDGYDVVFIEPPSKEEWCASQNINYPCSLAIGNWEYYYD